MTIEELQEQLLQAQENNTKLQAEIEAEKAKNAELVTTNERLTDYNNKLFMRVTEPIKNEQVKEEPKTYEEAEAQEIDKIRKLMQERRI